MIYLIRNAIRDRRDRTAFWWWVKFERACLYETRRGNHFLVAMLGKPELRLWEGKMSRMMLVRAEAARHRHEIRAMRRERLSPCRS
jgi:hypothetical protein